MYGQIRVLCSNDANQKSAPHGCEIISVANTEVFNMGVISAVSRRKGSNS